MSHPHAACRREVEEETGLDRVPGRIIAVDWLPADLQWPEGLFLMYDGGVLAEHDIRRIVVDGAEISEFCFAAPDQVAVLASARQGRRVAACLAALRTGEVLSLEDLDEADDWAVAQQKLALACRGAGRLAQALRYIGTAASGIADTPMQRVRLATAHAHILLTDPATVTSGRALLSQARRLAAGSGLTHQLRAIEAIGEQAGPILKGTAAS